MGARRRQQLKFPPSKRDSSRRNPFRYIKGSIFEVSLARTVCATVALNNLYVQVLRYSIATDQLKMIYILKSFWLSLRLEIKAVNAIPK